MKVDVDNKNLFQLSEHHKKVIQWDIPTEDFENDMKRRIQYIVMHKYQQCIDRLIKEWEPKLRERFPNLPTNQEALANLIMNQPDYKDRSQRQRENRPVNNII